METPLYLGHRSPSNLPENSTAHKGLWFERFFNQYDTTWTIPKPKKDKESAEKIWIDSVSDLCGDKTALKTHLISQSLLCESLQGKSLIFKNNWHFVTGMGNNHPVENGMSWHPTLGTPYFTGSSVKGLLRAWMEEWSDLEGDKLKEKLFLWFGSDDKDPKKQQKDSQAGGLIFFDAIPIDQVKLACDIMTPHMGKWYSDGGNITKESYSDTLPADWHNPIPIPFLVVKQASLQFSIAPRPHAKISTRELQEVMQMLTMALEYLGAGAKTATGYGRFEFDKTAKDEREKAQKEAKDKRENAQKEAQIKAMRKAMSPEERFIDERKDWKEKKLAEMFGKNFSSYSNSYSNSNRDKCEKKEDYNWDKVISIFINKKKSLVESWSEAGKNTAQGKAYKRLKPYL